MDRKNIGISGLLVIALLLVLTPVLGCTALRPLTGKPNNAVIYHFGDTSGPYAPTMAAFVAGYEDFAARFNKEGGIDGVPIVDVFQDTGGDPDAAMKAYQTFKAAQPHPAVNIVYSASECDTLRKLYAQDGILCFTNSPADRCIYPPGYVFSTIPSYPDSMGAFIDWVAGHWADKTGQDVKLAILTWDSIFGRAIKVDAVREYAAEKGVDIVYEGVFEVGDTDVSTQMTEIKDAGANWIYDNTMGHGPAVIDRGAAALDMLNLDLYDTTPGTIHRARGPWGMDQSAVALAGELAEGTVGPRSLASWSMSEVEGVAAATAAFYENNRKPDERTIGYLAGWCETYTVCHAMSQVVDDPGWEKLNGTTLRDQLLELKNFRPQGITRYTFTADHPAPRETLIFKVERGRLLPITDWVTCPDLRPASFR